jgi:hypothetical protein
VCKDTKTFEISPRKKGDCSSNKKIQNTKIAKLQSALRGHPLENPPGRIFEVAPLSAVAN